MSAVLLWLLLSIQFHTLWGNKPVELLMKKNICRNRALMTLSCCWCQGPGGTDGWAWLSVPTPGAPPPCPWPRTSCHPWGRQPLPQGRQHMAGLQVPTALPCPTMGPAELRPPTGPYPSLALAFLHLQGGAWCPGLGLPWCPPAALLLAGAVEWDRLPGPAPMGNPHAEPP